MASENGATICDRARQGKLQQKKKVSKVAYLGETIRTRMCELCNGGSSPTSMFYLSPLETGDFADPGQLAVSNDLPG